jgi:hypothetical protein
MSLFSRTAWIVFSLLLFKVQQQRAPLIATAPAHTAKHSHHINSDNAEKKPRFPKRCGMIVDPTSKAAARSTCLEACSSQGMMFQARSPWRSRQEKGKVILVGLLRKSNQRAK